MVYHYDDAAALQAFANEFAYTTRHQKHLFWAFPWGDASSTFNNFTRTEFLDWVDHYHQNNDDSNSNSSSSTDSNPLRFLKDVRITSNDISVAGRTCSMDWIGAFPILMQDDQAPHQPASCTVTLSGRSLYSLDSTGRVIQALHHYDATTVATQVAACRRPALVNNSQPSLLSVFRVNPLVAKTCRHAFWNLFPTSSQFVTIIDVWKFVQETFTPLQASSIVSGHPQLYFSWPEGGQNKNDVVDNIQSSSLINFVPNDLILWFLQHPLWNPQKGVLKYTAQLENDTVAVVGPVCSMNVRLVAQTTGPSSCPIELPMRLWIKVHGPAPPATDDVLHPHRSTKKRSKRSKPATSTTIDTWMLHYDEETLQHQISTCEQNVSKSQATADDLILGRSATDRKSAPREASNPATTQGKTTTTTTTTKTTTILIPSHGVSPLLQANHYPVLLLLLATALLVFLMSAATWTRLAHYPRDGDQPDEVWCCREPQKFWCGALGTSEEKTRLIANC